MKKIIINNQDHLITSVSVMLLILSVIAYMYFLSLSVVHVVMRKETDQKISLMRSEISNLEASYIEAKHQISAKVASLDGYKNNQDKIFISRVEPSLVLNNSGF